MKKLIIFLILLAFLAVSCGGSKKTENDADILPDEDEINDEEEYEPDEDYPIYEGEEKYGNDERGKDWQEEPETGSPCENFANTDGMIRYDKDGSFECGCIEGYFWGHLGCKKITYSNFCTGQEYCYDWYNYTHGCSNAGNLSGQDPFYSREGYCLEQNFTRKIHYADEAIYVDNNLHISWMNKVSANSYTWEDAVKYCEDLKYGGRDDWRLPLPEELAVSPANSGTAFSVWSSGIPDNDSSFAWVFNSERNFELRNKSVKVFVRCVRGESLAEKESFSSASRFQTIEINGVEIIRDLKSGIIWQKNFKKTSPWSDGLVFCEHSDFAGFSDWRLPNINEIFFLMDFKEDIISFPIDASLVHINSYFWSSTTNENASNLPAYGVDFLSGRKVNMSRDQYNTIARSLCMRNEPCKEGYWWTGVKCAKSPCDEKPCEKIEYSNGKCGTEDFETYYCGCVDGWFWDGVKCVNPCEKNPCSTYENTTGECRGVNSSTYICDCAEGYYWWGQNKGCLEKRPDLANICSGQTHCYDEMKKIKCPAEGEDFYGQDAQYALLGTCVPKNYVLNDSVKDEPTVYDRNTDLEWQQKIPHEAYLSWGNADNYCYTLNYAGHDDWRLPTFDELRTILDFDDSPLANAKYFPDTPGELFWTSSFTSPEYEYSVYTVDFEDGYLGESTVSSPSSEDGCIRLSAIRCVRGRPYNLEHRHTAEIKYEKDFAFYGNSATGLLWTKILPEESEMIFWADYLKYCEELDAVGLSNWRLPNVNELYSISLRERYIDFGISSTTKLDNPESVFGGGIIYKDDRRPSYIVCVTENPCVDGEIWNGEKCVPDKCRHDICGNKGISMGSCIPGEEGDPGYSCRCYEDYHWNSEKKQCIEDPKEEETPDSDADTDEFPDSDTDVL